MNVVVKRRLMRNRLEPERSGFPWWGTAILGLFAFLSVGAAATVGALFVAYASLADGYVPIEQKIEERYVGLTVVYDRSGPEHGVFLGTLANPTVSS